MLHWFAWSVAAFSTAAALLLWFRDVRKLMDSLMSTLESAAGQAAACRERAIRARGDPEASAIADRSDKIYTQALERYNYALRKPWYSLPARLMGFHSIDP